MDTSSCSNLANTMSGGFGLLGTLKRKIIESKAEVEKWKKTVEEASWKIKVGNIKKLEIRLVIFHIAGGA